MFDTKSTQRLGNDGFIWFYGVVENVDDPLQLGRMKVRVLGDHTQSKKNIPTDDLPWAYPVNDIHSSSTNGIGSSPTGLCVLGSWVFGFYSDGIDKQQMMILGSFGGIGESISWKTEDVGFQDPNNEFPIPQQIFEQDTNRLARNSPKDHAVEIPEDLVPPQETMIKEGLCPKKADYGKKYYDEFDEKFVRYFAQQEKKKHSCDDTEIDVSDTCDDTKEIKVKDKKDEKCQYFLETNDHPFTVYKFINRERFIPKAKVFSDRMHWEYWHEPDNPWAAKYPYNKVWEGYHKNTSTTVENPGKTSTGKFVSESYGYNKTIEDYDGSDKEGIHRKQECGIGSWGLGEEWDQTEGAQRYHRFHPKGNYFEIDNDGNEVTKIYGDSFEIDMKDRTLLVKGDWNVTVEGDENKLIEGDLNLQILGDKNIDVRGDIKTHSDGKAEYHYKDSHRIRIDGDDRQRVSGDRNTSILKKDYTESVDAERLANTIIRRGAESMLDEAFMDYKFMAHDALIEICTLKSQIDDLTSEITTKEETITTFTEEIYDRTSKYNSLIEDIGTHTQKKSTFNEDIGTHNETVRDYIGDIQYWEVHSLDFEVYYADVLLFEQAGYSGGIPSIPSPPSDAISPVIFDEKVKYPETDGIQQCLEKYNECIESAKGACMTTLKDPRTLEDVERFDWEKYHASIDSCKRSYEQCVESNKGRECDVCNPIPGSLDWSCLPDHDPNCPTDDKKYEFYECSCPCHSSKEEKKEDPWEESEQEKP